MIWLIQTLFSSIGKKVLMALTGLSFCTFLAMHLFGNLSIYGGNAMFTAYAEHLHAFGILINIAEIGLLAFALLHMGLATLLYIENWRARPIRYVMKKRAGGRTMSSSLMPYTGLYLVFFLVIHLISFHFADHTPQTTYRLVADAFAHPLYVLFYIFSMIVVSVHVKHGFWSAFQTIGANHPKYMPIVQIISFIFSLAVGIGFGSIPLFIYSAG